MGDLRVMSQKRKKNKSVASKIYISFVSVFFIFYIIGSILALTKKQKIPSAMVVYGSVGIPEIIDGIVIRTESLYKSQSDGVLFYFAGEGERVKKGGAVCSVRNESEIAAIEAELSSINSSILNTQKSRADFSIVSEDVKREDEKIKLLLNEGMYKLLDSNMSALYNLRDGINKHLDLRNQMLLTEDRGSIASLSQERAAYISKMEDNISSIKAERSGIVSYILDGFEDTLNPGNIENLSKFETTMRPDTVHSSGEVNTGDNIFKIVESNEWYIAAYIPTDLIDKWQEDSFRTIYVKSHETEAYISQEAFVSKITNIDAESYVIMKCTKGIQNFLHERNIQFKVTEGTSEGIKIPNSAIVDISLFKVPTEYLSDMDNGKALIRETEGGSVIVPVVLKGGDDETSLILQDFSGLKIGSVVLHPESNERYVITELENVKGVYMLNTGIAEFKPIVMEANAPSNSQYTILDKEANSAIRAYDMIVSDAKNVSEGQTIF